MAKDFLTEPPNDTQQDAEPTDDRENREPVRIMLEFRLSRLKSVIAVRLGNSSQERQW